MRIHRIQGMMPTTPKFTMSTNRAKIHQNHVIYSMPIGHNGNVFMCQVQLPGATTSLLFTDVLSTHYLKWCRRKNLAIVRTSGKGAIPSDTNNSKPTDAISLGRIRSRSKSDLTAVPAKKPRLDISGDASEYCYSCGSLNIHQIRQRALRIANNPPPARIPSATVFFIINGVVSPKMNKEEIAKKFGLNPENTTFINTRPNMFKVEEVNSESAIFKLKIKDSTEFPFDERKNNWKTAFCSSEIRKNKSEFIYHYLSVSEVLRLFVLATAAETDPTLHASLPENWKLATAMENTLIKIYNNQDKRDHLESMLTKAGRRRLYHEMISIGWTPNRQETHEVAPTTSSNASSE